MPVYARVVAAAAAAAAAMVATLATVAPATATPTTPVQPKIVGMSAPSSLWAQRISEVGTCDVKARRIFANLSSDGKAQSRLIEQAVHDGMLPVISYKADPALVISGKLDTALDATRTYLESLGVQVTATYWHEPNGDMTGATFRAASLRFLQHVQAPTVAVGPILNGWLLDRQTATFASFTDKTLLDAWDFVAVDSYQSGTQSSPGSSLPARAIPLLATWLDGQGYPDMPIGLGEYNGFTAAAMAQAGEAILSTPEVWFALAWNSQGGSAAPLTGDRITAYQNTKTDPRAAHNC